VVGAESTVVAEFAADGSGLAGYQSEADLEWEFIGLLQSQAYEYLPITNQEELVLNLRSQLETLNSMTFSTAEWEQFFTEKVAGVNDSIRAKTVRIQEDHVQLLKRDDGTTKNILLIDKTNIHNNRLQVINQYEVANGEGGAKHANRYDVTVLVNGLPFVHIELKRRGVDIREAFNQIDRYQRDSFWAGSGLFEYAQLFVISNGTLTKYYSNTTRRSHLDEAASGAAKSKAKKTSNSFEFTSWWADATNRPIQDLSSFTKTFFAKHTLLNILTKYCVLTADRMLLVMRPYQIVATERILQKIDISTNYKKLGSVEAGGFVWHTTGSGKTLTSFKTAQLASRLPAPVGRQGAVRGRPQRPRLPDHARVRPVREGSRELQHLHRGVEEAAGGSERPHHHHHHPETRHVHHLAGEQGSRNLRRPHCDHLRRVSSVPVRRHAHGDRHSVQAV